LRTSAATSALIPIDGPPISSQARATPMKKQTVTTIAIVSTEPESPGWATTSAPAISWSTNVTMSPARNRPSRTALHRTSCRRTSDSSDAMTNRSPKVATITAVQPIFSPGISANSDTASALVKAVSAADARMRWN
jgi:hypothetical protein